MMEYPNSKGIQTFSTMRTSKFHISPPPPKNLKGRVKASVQRFKEHLHLKDASICNTRSYYQTQTCRLARTEFTVTPA